jgi:hypothetical protein
VHLKSISCVSCTPSKCCLSSENDVSLDNDISHLYDISARVQCILQSLFACENYAILGVISHV